MKPDNRLLSRQPRSAPLWIASRALLCGLEEEFFERWRKTARRFQEDEVHDFRVASRRLREGLDLFSACFPGKGAGRVVKQVKTVTRMLGDLRNTDEAFLFFSSLAPEEISQSRDQVEELLTALRRERELAHKKLKKELRALDPVPLRNNLKAVQQEQNLFGKGGVDPFTSIAFFARDAFLTRAQPLVELSPLAMKQENSEAQHQLRIAVKKMRYRLEILAPLLRSGYDELHGALKGHQDALGKLHDVDVFGDLVRERLEDGAGRQALLQVLAERRSSLHGSFLEMLESFPIGSVGEKARDAL